MKKFFSTLLGLGAFLFAICLHLGNAASDYGLSSNTLSVKVQAQMVAINNQPSTTDNDVFTFNGASWSTNYFAANFFGSNWRPEIKKCLYTPGGWSFGYEIAYYSSSKSSYFGHGILCSEGTGNCINGTSCIPD